jgi:aspartyl-tRNA(Asn)/glutamyl-tRNA(Gln) amidotransferase subunit A
MTELWRCSALELLRLYDAGEATPAEAVASCLARIAATDDAVQAFTHLRADDARREADAATAALRANHPRGALHGVPVAVKELVDVDGLPSTAGSFVLAARRADRDAAAVARLRAAGAIVLGLTRTHEFAWGITTQHAERGSTRNPWNLAAVPGGSSGGSGAAVAVGAVPLALGTDTGGSVRIPAAFCGVVGLKPTFGLIDTTGVVPLAPSLDHVGVLGREVDDIALALEVVVEKPPVAYGGVDELAALWIGLPADGTPGLARAYAEAVAAATSTCRDAGATIVEVDWPRAEDFLGTFATIQLAEAFDVHHRQLATFPARAEDYGRDVRRRLERAAQIDAGEVAVARAARDALRARVREVFTSVDLVLTPASRAGPSRVDAPDRVEHDGETVPLRTVVLGCTALQDLTGQPAIVVPGGLDEHGLPVGVQLTGAVGEDALVLAAAAELRSALRPRLPAWPPL